MHRLMLQWPGHVVNRPERKHRPHGYVPRPLPVYGHLNQRVRAVLAMEYRSEDQFLTAREVAEKFQVSRATASKALASLISEGFLEFRKGPEAFVT